MASRSQDEWLFLLVRDVNKVGYSERSRLLCSQCESVHSALWVKTRHTDWPITRLVLWHDVWKPEHSLARQRHANTRFRGNGWKENNRGTVRHGNLYSVRPEVIKELVQFSSSVVHPCEGGVEYLHRDPANRRRRRKGKSQIWDSKLWSQVPRDSDPRKTALARASSTYKRQTRTSRQRGRPTRTRP
jgi:hypothetical protein